MKINYCCSTFIFLLCFCISAKSQISNFENDTKLAKMIEVDSIMKAKDDSLRNEFYSSPPYLTVNLEVNRESVDISKDFEFLIESKGQIYEPNKINENQYLTNQTFDTISFLAIYKTDTIRFDKIEYHLIRNGATFRFGVINDIRSIRTFYKSQNKNKEDEDWDRFDDIYLKLINDKKLMRQSKKIKSIHFLYICPRYYCLGLDLCFINVYKKTNDKVK